MSMEMTMALIVPDPNAVPLFEDRFENPAVGLVRVRRADLMKDTRTVRLWEWYTLEGRDGEPGVRHDQADYWSIAELDVILSGAKASQ